MNVFHITRKISKTIYYSLKFFLNLKKNEPLLVSLPRSGTHLTFGLLNICYSMKLGYEGKLGVADNGYSAFAKLQMPFDERSIFHKYKFPHLWHSHLPYTKIVPLRKRFCKTIVLIREPVEGVKSFILHAINAANENNYFEKEMTFEDYIELEKKYKFTEHYSLFLETWKKRKINVTKQNIEIIDHKYIKNNTYNYIKFLNNYYEFNFSDEQMKIATKELDLERISSISSKKSVRISKNKINFSKNIEKYIIKSCEKKYLEILQLANKNIVNPTI